MERMPAIDRSAAQRTATQDLRAALLGNGTSSFVATPVVMSGTHFNIAFWYKRLRNHHLMETIASNDRDGTGFSIRFDGNARHLYLTFGNNGTYTYGMNFPAYPAGEWHHVAITARKHDVRGYLDGRLAFAHSGASLPVSSVPLELLRRPGDARFANGILSNVVVENGTYWNPARVQDVMSGRFPAGAASIYRLHEGAGPTAYDTSANGNHATINNAQFVRDVPSPPRTLVEGNLAGNGIFAFAPPPALDTPTTADNTWIDNTGGSDNNVFGWTLWVRQGTGTAMFDHGMRWQEQPTLKITTTTAGSTVAAGIARGSDPQSVRQHGIATAPNTRYTAKVAIRTQVLGGAADSGAYLAVEEYDGDGTLVESAPTPQVRTTSNFTEYSIAFSTKSSTRYLVPQLYVRGNDGAGTLRMTAWFGAVHLIPATTPPVGDRLLTGETIALTDPLRGVGICNPFSSYNNAQTIRSRCAVIRQAGLTWVRTDFRAAIINPERNTFVWDAHDTLVHEVLDSGLRLLPILDYAAPWGNGGLDPTYPWLDPQDFATYCAAVVARYAPLGIKHYEIWNEPNISTFWKPMPDPFAYGLLLKAAYRAIKAVDPTVTVIMGGITGDQDPEAVGPAYHGPYSFLRNVYRTVGSPMDAVAYHAYTNTTAASWQERNTLGLRDMMVAHGDAHKPLWITEYGRPTGGTEGQEYVSEAMQARFYSSFIRDTRRYPWLGPVFLYNYQDVPQQQPDREGHFGLLRSDGTYKPSFYAVRNAIKGLYL